MPTPNTSGKRTYSPDPKIKPRGPKKSGRTVDKTAGKRARAKQARCSICSERGTESHHVLNRSQGGADLDANLCVLCHSCHELITANNVTARRKLGEYLVCERLDTLQYLTEKLGEEQGADWLRRRLFIL